MYISVTVVCLHPGPCGPCGPGQKANGCVANDPHPAAKDLVKGTGWGGFAPKNGNESSQLGLTISRTGQDTSRSDWSSQAGLQSLKKKTSEIRAISGNDRKTWIHDPQRLCSGYCILHEKIPIIFRYPQEKNEDVPDKTIFLSSIGFCLHPHLRINMFGP